MTNFNKDLWRRGLDLKMAAAGHVPKKKRKRTGSEPRTMAEIQIAAVLEAIALFGGHRKRAAERLEISEATLYRILAKSKADKLVEEKK